MCVPAKTHEAEQSASPKVPSHTTTMITALSHLDRNDDMLHCMQRRFVLRTPMPLWKRPSQQPTSLWCSKRHLAYHSQPRTRCLSQGLVPVCVLALRDRLSQWLQLQPCIPFCHASLKIHGYAGMVRHAVSATKDSPCSPQHPTDPPSMTLCNIAILTQPYDSLRSKWQRTIFLNRSYLHVSPLLSLS
jgi:hypothetical protein